MFGQIKYLKNLFRRNIGSAGVAADGMDIAIIGLAGRYPQADNLAQLWQNLSGGVDSITEIPSERWPHQNYFEARPGVVGKTYSKWGGFIDGVEHFDPLFFNISPREAAVQDPQERLFLQCAWDVLEDAGYTREQLNQQGAVGVFAGVQYQDYKFFSTDEIQVAALPGSIANRVSWFCNFTGPSITLDTMCSASLSAIHQACNSIQAGDCYCAIAGGVNLTIHPIKYLLHAQGRFASTHGRCMAFGDRGDGYVPAEGVGAVLLKPLAVSLADGDNIYAVIKGSAINHGGYARGFTVPKASAQSAVIRQAQDKAGIDLEAINYIEAHGTGTILGDYVEFDGLTQAYAGTRSEGSPCAVGSIKSNIGHCESAAGIAGLTKILLQLRHRQWVPSLHSGQLNRNIDFSSSRFFIPQHNQPWENVVVKQDGRKIRYPLTAALSGFGAGGSNAHLIIQEAVLPPRTTQPASAAGFGLLLSARTGAQLRSRAEKLLHHIAQTPLQDKDLPNLAFTLAVGREAMACRLAFRATTMTEVSARLQDFLLSRSGQETLWQGQVKSKKTETKPVSLLTSRTRDELENALRSWTSGAALENEVAAYRASGACRITLPGYPFARKRTWMAGSDFGLRQQAQDKTRLLTLEKQQHNRSDFLLTLSGEENFLRHHKINGKAILPGVFYLEIARQAVDMLQNEQNIPLNIDDLYWLRPVIVTDQARQLKISLIAVEEGKWDFLIADPQASDASSVFCRAVLCRVPYSAERQTLDLSIEAASRIEANELYTRFAALGINYGASHQRLAYLTPGDTLVLAKMNGAAQVDEQDFTLIPGVLDSALQATLGLSLASPDAALSSSRLALPFAVKRVELSGDRLPALCWARVELQSVTDSAIQQCDILLADEQGKVQVRILGYQARQVNNAASSAPDGALYAPDWVPVEADMSEVSLPHLILTGASDPGLDMPFGQLSQAQVVRLAAEEADTGQRYQGYVTQLVILIQQWIKPEASGIIQLLARPDFDGYLMRSLYSLLLSVQAEHLALKVQLIEMASDETPEGVAQRLKQMAAQPAGHFNAEQTRVQQRIFRQLAPRAQVTLPWKNQATYLISGGNGALGRLFCAEILRHAPKAHVVLMLRRPADEALQQWLNALPAPQQVMLMQVDLNDRGTLRQAIVRVQRQCPTIRGVIHAAGYLDDARFSAKTAQGVAGVLQPKVQGSINLDQVSRDLPLDFFAFFSSISAVFGNAGQSDYAAANSFMDNYAAWRHQLQQNGRRHGRSLSLNWPLWAEGGMQLSQTQIDRISTSIGLYPLPVAQAFDAFYQAVESPESQVMVLYGNQEKIARILPHLGRSQSAEQPQPAQTSEPEAANAQASLTDVSMVVLKERIAALLGIDENDIDSDSEFEMLGFDSVSMSEFIAQVQNAWGVQLSMTKMYDLGCLRQLHQLLKHVSSAPAASYAPIPRVPDESKLKALAAELLQVNASDIDEEAEFDMLGFDSVSLNEFIGLLQQQHGLQVSLAQLYNCGNLAALRRSLMDEERNRAPLRDAEPAAVVQTGLLERISLLLGVDQADIDGDASFDMLGFDSITLSELSGFLLRDYGLTITLTELYQFASLNALQSFVQEKATVSARTSATTQPDAVADTRNFYPLSSTQQVMLEKIAAQPAGMGLYQPILVYGIATPRLEKESLQRSLATVIAHYSNLNTEFLLSKRLQRVQVQQLSLWPLPEHDLRSLSAEAQQQRLLTEVRQAWQESGSTATRHTDLRCMLFRIDEQQWSLLFVTHHAVLDGWSFTQFIHTLERVWRQDEHHQALDVGNYQARFPQRVHLEQQALNQPEQRAIRQQLLAGHKPLGWQEKQPAATTGFAEIVSETRQLTSDEVNQLQRWARAVRLPLKGAFLSALYQVLGEYSARDRITIEWVCNGRTPQIEGVYEQMGLYWSWVPVCCQLTSNGLPDPATLKKQLLMADESALYPCHTQSEKTDEVVFNFIQFASGTGENSRFRLHSMYDRFHHPLKLLVSVDDSDGSATLAMDFASRYFDAGARTSLMENYRSSLMALASLPIAGEVA
ncbi:KR domain-containing protein [Xenorhabdus bovienii]|uniref:beta-ketoacyl synthase N-terminal-like domain-containing protein n=1 Tax=Xenorhabdus bovienii TaxID=40576 RepID=UPI0023B328FB|nr:beta-ketoacyl synthase N-terminal-like domain-containing protein [Xenorhabdus bovienii]MDE9482416.1 KR domain-containing protein [Xenorhabdus bovienii]MDE9556292.1 KR domain-containing protein [Xenorhabdus bovienii]